MLKKIITLGIHVEDMTLKVYFVFELVVVIVWIVGQVGRIVEIGWIVAIDWIVVRKLVTLVLMISVIRIDII